MERRKDRRIRLSLAMIVKDESRFLPGCLESVCGVADESILVDTGSTDDTVAIAASHGARVFHHMWRDDFASARNESLRQCTGEWILALDADERLAPGQEELLRRCLGDRDVAAWTVLVRSTATMPTGPSVQVMPYARLFRNDPRYRYEGTIHEQISPSIERACGKISPSALVIEHLGYGQGVEVLRRKAERNLRLLHERLRRNPRDSYACYQIGNTASMFQRYGEAKEYLRRALRQGGLPGSLRALVLNLLAEAELRTGNAAGAEECCRDSIALAPVQLTARWYLVGAKVEKKDFAGAVGPLREILAMFFDVPSPPPIDVSVDLQMEEWRVRQITGQCLWKTGDTAGALLCFADALRLNPASDEVHANYATALRALGAQPASL
jgi:tetratricopeptide (TPR) repeat protein